MEFCAPSTAQVHGDLFIEEKRSPSPAIYSVGKKKDARIALLSEAGNGRKPIDETNRITLSVPHWRSSGVDLHGQCKPLLMMEKKKKRKEREKKCWARALFK